MEARGYARMGVAFVALALALVVALGCDRGIGPYDPDEKPSQPDLAQIYPDGASGAKRPMGGGPMGAAAPNAALPAPAPQPGPTRGNVPASGETIRGRIEIAPDLAGQASGDALLFVIARRNGQVGGPPLAVVRVPQPSFPVDFEIGQAQVMIPSLRFEGEITLSARLDGDGNAMTKLPGDLAGEIANALPVGASDVVLTLDQKL